MSEPSEQMRALIEEYREAEHEGPRYFDAQAALFAAVARLEAGVAATADNEQHDPAALRTPPAGAPVAWAVMTTLGRVWELHERRPQAEAAAASWKAKSLTLVPLYAGPSGERGSERSEEAK